jgi:hypothetical protein
MKHRRWNIASHWNHKSHLILQSTDPSYLERNPSGLQPNGSLARSRQNHCQGNCLNPQIEGWFRRFKALRPSPNRPSWRKDQQTSTVCDIDNWSTEAIVNATSLNEFQANALRDALTSKVSRIQGHHSVILLYTCVAQGLLLILNC